MQDQVMPAGKWQFDAEVTDAFEDMLARSIPQYDVMRESCAELAKRFIQPKTAVIDIGCSRGDALAPLVQSFGAHNRFIGLDVSEPMLAAARERFSGLIRCGVVDIAEWDLRQGLPTVQKASVILSILTLQFVPIEYRQRLVQSIFDSLVPGGACLIAEKVLGASAELDTAMVAEYLSLKAAHGYSQEQIERKRFSLEGVLVPVTAAWNEELLRVAGFRQVDCFWRWMNFAAWVAIR